MARIFPGLLKLRRNSGKIKFNIEIIFWTVVMAKIYISSTYVDLKKEREAAAKVVAPKY